MKKILLSIVFFLQSLFSLQAQTLYGTTSKGGNDGGGTINKFMPATNKLTVAKSFESFAAGTGRTDLIQASDGKLYGVAGGGSKDAGVILSFDLSNSKLTKLKNFDGSEGAHPSGSLIQANNGKLYGMTIYGGSNNIGVIFSFDPVSSTYTKLIDFDGKNGANPEGGLVQATNGKLYGMTFWGGDNGAGVIFSFDPSSSIYTKMTDLNNTDGSHPYGTLIQASDGKLYGMTAYKGNSNSGVIFSFDPGSSKYTKLRDFEEATGRGPFGSLMQAGNGKLYGMTANGGTGGAGVIFSFDPSSSKYTKLKDFGESSGSAPMGSLIQTSDGKLYGMTTEGGSIGGGVIFSLDPSLSKYTKLKDLGNADGGSPNGSLMQANDGKLYGATSKGGINIGVIFSYDLSNSAYTKVNDLGTNESGSSVNGILIKAGDGKLYGMTTQGGSNGVGAIFSFDPASSKYEKLMDFDNTNGAYPSGSLMQAKNGKLYGMTSGGGKFGAGVIFSLDASSSKYTKLKDFDFDNGGFPSGSLIQASDGKLYGVTVRGGSSDRGVIFSIDLSSSTYTKLMDFDGINGASPYGNLMQATNGRLYGMTDRGGTVDVGVIFTYDPFSSAYTKLKEFDLTDGGHSYGSFIQASDEKLYGMTYQGGSSDSGVIFSFDLLSSTYTKLKDFDNTDGGYPYGSLMQASDGKLYGMTSAGGSSGLGVIFSFDPSSSTYKKLKDYDGANGAFPYFGSAFIEVKSENKSPTVKITSPSKDTSYIGPATISLVADAKDEDGLIKKVQFYNGSTLLVTENYFPYTFKWTDVQPGSYNVTAKATDDKGAVTTSAVVKVTVLPNYAPIITITSPATNAKYIGPALIPLIADAKDFDGTIKKVEFYNGTTLLATEHYLPYTFTWNNVQPGNYAITAKATDDKGVVTTSAAVHVSVLENKPPTVSITYPANNTEYISPALIPLIADAEDVDGTIKKVEFYNGSILLATEKYFPYTFTWVNVAAGNYAITAKATDDKGGVTTSAVVNATVLANKPPMVNIISPADNTTYTAPALIGLLADARDPDGTIKKVQFYNGTTLLATENYFPYTYTWVNVPAGNYAITAKSTDDKGMAAISAPINLTVATPKTLANEEKTNTDKGSNSRIALTVLGLKASPNPATNILNIQTTGFEQNKKLAISVISVSGAVVKTIYTKPNQTMQMNVSSLKPGGYFLKVLNGEKVLYKKFVKL